MRELRYLILIEAGQPGFSAYAPDLPGCVATAATRDDVEREMHDALAFHLQGLQEAGELIPEPSGLTAAYVKVAAEPHRGRDHASTPPDRAGPATLAVDGDMEADGRHE